jgi:hypothetical protein
VKPKPSQKTHTRPAFVSILRFRAANTLLGAALLLLACLASNPRASAQGAAHSNPAIPLAPGWQTYSYPADGFRAAFPSEPKLSTQNVDTQAGTFALRDYLVDMGSTALYIGVCDYGSGMSGRDPKTVLDGAQSGAIENVKGHLLSSKVINYGSYQGREFEAENDQLHFTARIYLVDTVLYQNLVAFPLNTHYANAYRFLNSFELIPRNSK